MATLQVTALSFGWSASRRPPLPHTPARPKCQYHTWNSTEENRKPTTTVSDAKPQNLHHRDEHQALNNPRLWLIRVLPCPDYRPSQTENTQYAVHDGLPGFRKIATQRQLLKQRRSEDELYSPK